MADTFKALIREEERKAERLISMIRVGAAVGLALVFGLAVSGQAADGDPILTRQISLARLTLATCFAIGILGLIVSSRRIYRSWFAYFFVSADVSLTITSLHLAIANTGLMPGAMPTLPSMWLVPLILSFNSLRFNAGPQLFGGILLVAGLFVILLGPSAESGIFISERLFDIQPNTMRIAMIAAACTVLSLAVVRARKLLFTALTEERQRLSLTRYMPAEVAHLITERSSDALRRGTFQEVAVLFVDIRAFTARTEAMAPDDLRAFLTRYRQIVRTAVEGHGGIVDKFVGDGALGVFGVPKPGDDDAAKAGFCALSLIDTIADWSDRLVADGNAPVSVGIGVHTGKAFVGAVGDDSRLEFTVLGDTVNVASRLEEATKTLGASVLLSGEVVEAGGLSHAFERLGTHALKGRSIPVEVFAQRTDAKDAPASATSAALTTNGKE